MYKRVESIIGRVSLIKIAGHAGKGFLGSLDHIIQGEQKINRQEERRN